MSDFIDPYLDPETGILKNLVGAKTQEELEQVETNIIAAADLSLKDVPRTNTADELLAIHKALFGRIYSWAGKIRTVDIRKGSQEYFLYKDHIPTGLNYVFSELQDENFLKGKTREDFVVKLAYFYEQLNFIHPFREGNGRTQRIFWTRIAADAGFDIAWRKVVGDELNQASAIGREKHDLKPLEVMFEKIVAEKGLHRNCQR